MKSAGLILAMVSGVGLLWVAAPNALSQKPGFGANPDSVPESTVDQPLPETKRIQAVLNDFNYALSMHDVGMLQATGIDQESGKRWQRFFSENPSATVTDQCPVSELFISVYKALWTCTETVTVVSEGKPKSFVHLILFTFAKKKGNWTVADRDDLETRQAGKSAGGPADEGIGTWWRRRLRNLLNLHR